MQTQLIISITNLADISLVHTTDFSKANCTLSKVNYTFCTRKHTILGPAKSFCIITVLTSQCSCTVCNHPSLLHFITQCIDFLFPGTKIVEFRPYITVAHIMKSVHDPIAWAECDVNSCALLIAIRIWHWYEVVVLFCFSKIASFDANKSILFLQSFGDNYIVVTIIMPYRPDLLLISLAVLHICMCLMMCVVVRYFHDKIILARDISCESSLKAVSK